MEMTQTNGNQQQGLSKFFGEFAKPSFYGELARVAFREIARAAILAFAGALAHVVQQKLSGTPALDFKGFDNSNNNTNSTTAANRAFNIQDTTNYSSSYNNGSRGYSPSTINSGSGTSSFPGFGRS